MGGTSFSTVIVCVTTKGFIQSSSKVHVREMINGFPVVPSPPLSVSLKVPLMVPKQLSSATTLGTGGISSVHNTIASIGGFITTGAKLSVIVIV